MAKEDRDDQKDPCRVQLKGVRLSYPALWRPKGFGKKNDGEPAYQAVFLMEIGDKLGDRNIRLIDDAIEAAKEKKWGSKVPKIKKDKICFKEGDPDDGEEQDGMMVLSARNYKKPRVLDIDKIDVDEGDDGAPYAGCVVDAIVRLWGQDNDYGIRVNCSLEAVRFRDDGEAFGAKPVDPDEFDDIDEDDKPSRRSRRSRDDDDDDDRSSRRSRRGRDDDDDEDDKPSRRSSRDKDDDDDDDRSSRRSRRSRDDDDDDDDKEARSSRRRRSEEDDKDDDEDRPSRNSRSRRSRDDDDEDDRPSRRRRNHDDV